MHALGRRLGLAQRLETRGVRGAKARPPRRFKRPSRGWRRMLERLRRQAQGS